jgi:dihydrofolate synthase/folylpolyglutamate synthase
VGADLRWVEPLAQNGSGDLWLATGASGLGSWSPCGLPGMVQAVNAAVAQGVLQALAERDWPIDAAAIRRGFAAARWPGRLQQLNWHGIPLLIDGAHNPPAAAALRGELDAFPERHGLRPGPRCWVIGMLANKEGPEIVEALLAPGDRAWIVPVPGHASWSRGRLVQQRPQLASALQTAPDLAQATALAWQGHGCRLVVAGSLYLLGVVLAG